MRKSFVAELNATGVDVGRELAEYDNLVGQVLVQEAIDELTRSDGSVKL